MIRATDREQLIAATAANRAQVCDIERDSWPVAERDDGPEHIAPILDRLLDIYALRGLDRRGAVA
ncbi:MAG: hypothetical protein NT013_00485 [Planctomycetia bacterium]|nr:hypothetical protein [Planctomycetia bacterium]